MTRTDSHQQTLCPSQTLQTAFLPTYLKLNSDVTLEHGNHGCIVVNPHIKKTWDEKKDYLYPIPIQDRLLNTNLTQNPGWNDGI